MPYDIPWTPAPANKFLTAADIWQPTPQDIMNIAAFGDVQYERRLRNKPAVIAQGGPTPNTWNMATPRLLSPPYGQPNRFVTPPVYDMPTENTPWDSGQAIHIPLHYGPPPRPTPIPTEIPGAARFKLLASSGNGLPSDASRRPGGSRPAGRPSGNATSEDDERQYQLRCNR